MDSSRIVLMAALAVVLCGAAAACGAWLTVRAARRGNRRGDGAFAVSAGGDSGHGPMSCGGSGGDGDCGGD